MRAALHHHARLASGTLGAAIAIGLAAGCAASAPQPDVTTLRIATGNPTGSLHQVGGALAHAYERSTPGVQVIAQPLPGAVYKVQALDERRVDLALVDADLAYAAYAKGTTFRREPHVNLRGIAVVFARVLHVMVRADSPARSVADLHDGLIGYGIPRYDDVMLPPFRFKDLMGWKGHGPTEEIQEMTFSLPELVVALRQKKIDSGIVLTTFPAARIQELSRAIAIRLLQVDPEMSTRLRNKDPFYKPNVLPRGTYPGQAEDIGTVGIDSLIVCREDLSEETAYKFAKVFFEDLPRMQRSWDVTLQFDRHLGAATPVPLHPGAARYFRERELLR